MAQITFPLPNSIRKHTTTKQQNSTTSHKCVYISYLVCMYAYALCYSYAIDFISKSPYLWKKRALGLTLLKGVICTKYFL